MKKFISIAALAACFALTSCMTTGAGSGSILGNVLGGGTLTNILYDVIGATSISESEIIGTWTYAAPGCAFTTENALSKAGGHVISAQVVSQLTETYSSLGVSSANTQFTFNQDKTFTAKLSGKAITGRYTYDPAKHTIALSTALGLGNITGYVTRSSYGMALTFESKKLLNIVQILGATSGNATLGTISQIASNYDGIRLGFDLTR